MSPVSKPQGAWCAHSEYAFQIKSGEKVVKVHGSLRLALLLYCICRQQHQTHTAFISTVVGRREGRALPLLFLT